MKPIICYNFATRSRPEKFMKCIDNIINKTASRMNYFINVVCDDDDDSMKFLKGYQIAKTNINWGKSNNKIHAINRAVPSGDWDILVNMSDDMEFLKYGFDEEIRDAFYKEKNGRNVFDSDQCIHFPDGNTKSLITMSILGRKYYERFNYIYHPDYTSLWADNEQTIVSIMLGKYKYVDLQIFSHNHPAFGKAPSDKQYQHTESYYRIDEDIFRMRKKKNFDLPTDINLPTFYPFSNTPV